MRTVLPPFVFLAAIAAAWQGLTLTNAGSAVSTPIETVRRLAELLETSRFWLDIAETGKAFICALVLSVSFGVLLGVILGLKRTAGDVIEPILLNFYSIPKVTLYPLVLLVFGLGISAKIAFGVMHGLVPVTLMTRNAIDQLKPVYWRTALVLRLKPETAILLVVMPAILPDVIAGIRIGMSLSLLGVLIGEMFASKRGLGFTAMNAMGQGDVKTIIAIGLFLTVFAVAANVALLVIESAYRNRKATD